MRIGIDMLGDQSAGRARGVGRYTRGLVARLLAEAEHEFVLYYYRGLPSVGNGLRAIPPGGGAASISHSRSFPRLRVGLPSFAARTELEARRVSEGDIAGASPGGGAARSADRGTPSSAFPTDVRELGTGIGGSLYPAIKHLARTNPDHLDVLLLTCPLENFQGHLPPFPPRGGPKLAAIVYDLIPLVYPRHYLRHPAIARAYHRATCALRQYDVLLTISDASRRDAVERLGVSADRVINIGAGSDEDRFGPAQSDHERQADAACLGRLGIREPFIFALTALDFRKNMKGLLAAAECLPDELRNRHQIVLACAMSDPDDGEKTRSLLAGRAVGDRVVLVEGLDDAALRALYRRAAVFVFPSRYEGFGLPLLEAMQCGAVVVAGNNSSQVEVVGDAGLMADVDRPEDLAACIVQALTDASLAERLRDRAVRQAARFTWSEAAKRCRQALEATAAAPRAAGRLRVWTARAQLAVAERVTRAPAFARRNDVLSRSESRFCSHASRE